MSDFLTNVAARAIAAPALRPRMRMRFEPPEAEPAPLLGEEPPRASQPREMPHTANAPEPHRIAAPPQPPATNPQPLIREIVRDRIINAAAPSDAPEERQPTPVAAEPQVSRIETIVRQQQADPEIETRIETREIVRDRIIAGAASQPIEPHVATPHRHDELPPRVGEQPPSTTTTIIVAPERIRESPRRNPQPPSRGRARNPRIAANAIAQRPRAHDDQPSSSTSEPVVHVSIGRVEVRAVTNAPSQKRAPQTSPVMTIDDYVARKDRR